MQKLCEVCDIATLLYQNWAIRAMHEENVAEIPWGLLSLGYFCPLRIWHNILHQCHMCGLFVVTIRFMGFTVNKAKLVATCLLSGPKSDILPISIKF